MKKRIFFILLLVSLTLVLFSCGNTDSDESFNDTSESSLFASEESEISEESETTEESSEMSFATSFPDPLEVGFEKYPNPFLGFAADPDIVFKDGKYYYCYSAGGSIFVSSFDDLGEATTHNAARVLSPIEGEPWARDIWAPELHWIDGHWYIYFAGSSGSNEYHRMFVLKSKTEDPMGEYEAPIKLTDPTDKWAIDGTVFKYKGELYYVWSGWPGDENVVQNIYISKMESPTELSGKRLILSMPINSWEKGGGKPLVNEGPYAIVDGDYLTILYSASGSWSDEYCIGQLLFMGGDVLNSKCWKKQPQPILKATKEKFYGPGHCSVVPDKNGVLWMVFHANLEPNKGWAGRSGWMYPIRINENGVVEVVLY